MVSITRAGEASKITNVTVGCKTHAGTIRARWPKSAAKG
jgi:hypothetical protein